MATMSVSLPSSMKDWVERQAETGRYGSASDYIGDLIRKDQQRQEAIVTLQAAVTEGIASGKPHPFEAAPFKRHLRASRATA